MPKMSGAKPVATPIRSTAAALLMSLGCVAATHAADCPRKGVLGTSRVLAVDPAKFPRVGLKSFPQTLPLRDHEVVLTFDDGPWPPTTPKVLAELAQECVHATFFLIGKPASEHPDLVRRIAAEGHTIGHHTWLHRSLMRIRPSETTDEIEHGISAVELALHGVATTTPSTPFFRFPGFESTPATLNFLQAQGIAVFGADLWASDWIRLTPQQELKLLIKRLKVSNRGASSCFTTPRPRRRPCCRHSCVICGTTTITWFIWFRSNRALTPRQVPDLKHVAKPIS